MSLVIGVISKHRARFLSDGFVLDQKGRVRRTDFNKIFVLPGGYLLAAIGDHVGIQLAQELQQRPSLSLGEVWQIILEWASARPDANSSFYLLGISDSELKGYGIYRDLVGWHAWETNWDAPYPMTWADGFFHNRGEVKERLCEISLLNYEGAALEAEGLFFKLRSENPSQIGGLTFCTEIDSAGNITASLVKKEARPCA